MVKRIWQTRRRQVQDMKGEIGLVMRNTRPHRAFEFSRAEVPGRPREQP